MPDGSFFEHKYDQDTTVEQITSSLFSDWPDSLGRKPDSNHLKLIFQGRFLHGALKLSGVFLHEYVIAYQCIYYIASSLCHVYYFF
ncbi:unnamed protein product [Schistosoma mattheei]|nr:unnamed protein product [Schistosoma mattheei]